jgi:hypothetical protein
MKAYTILRPDVRVYVQWDGTNKEEFEAMTGAQWSWIYMTGMPVYVENDKSLEVWCSDQLFAVIPVNHWFNGNVWADLNELPPNEAIVPTNAIRYTVEEL